jgi:DnaJ-class molecular chaperone
MKSAFETLDLSEDADDTEVKAAYLQKTKLFPPDQAPDRFQEIRQAYDAIKDQRSRIHYQLFHRQDTDLSQLVNCAFKNVKPVEINHQQIKKLLQLSIEKVLEQ